MRKILVAAALIAVTSSSARAADLGPRYTKAPAFAPAFTAAASLAAAAPPLAYNTTFSTKVNVVRAGVSYKF
jgi:opacity protein-like surface antigen